MSETKTCCKCDETKPLEDFNRRKRSTDGRQTFCRDCQKASYRANKAKYNADKKRWIEENPEKHYGYTKRWKQRNPEKISAINRKYRERHPEVGKKNVERYYDRHPEREKANRIVRKAVQTGKLKKPPGCERCGELKETHELDGHHPDYNDPLWVLWVDRQCHVDVHKEERGETPRTKAAPWFKLHRSIL
jgi:hypothetical protein